MIQPRHRVAGNAVRAITAAREPHRIDRGIIGAFNEGGEAAGVWPGEVAEALKALRMELQRQIRPPRSKRSNPARIIARNRTSRSADCNAEHGARLYCMVW